MSAKSCVLFPGQGSQIVGMGKDYFNLFPHHLNEADEILGYSVKDLCLNDPQKQLRNTYFTQPALFLVNSLMYLKYIEEHNRPDYFAGHSLGEFNALFAANVFDFATGLKIVKKRGELMSQAKEGGMAAVIGLSIDEIQNVLETEGIKNIFIANINSSSQIVLSGDKSTIVNSENLFLKKGANRYIVLQVGGAFHTPFMQEAQDEFEIFLKQFNLRAPENKVISNKTAKPYEDEKVQLLLASQITNSVKWNETIQYLLIQDVENFIEIGPGKVLTGLVETIKRESTIEKLKEIKLQYGENLFKNENNIVSNQKNGTIIQNGYSKARLIEPENVAFNHKIVVKSESLGSDLFKKRYRVKWAYVAGSMYKGISSTEMVIRMAKSGLIGYIGTGGLSQQLIEEHIIYLQEKLGYLPFGLNLLHNHENQKKEEELVNLYLKYGIKNIEASAFIQISGALVLFRIKNLRKDSNGKIIIQNNIIAKVSRPEVAELFIQPPAKSIVDNLLEAGKITKEEAELSQFIPMSHDICVESDSGGHTDQGMPFVLLPSIIKLKALLNAKYNYDEPVLVGAAGGIGTPEAITAALILGADFFLTGSINQCTVEAGISNEVKDILQTIDAQDTTLAPAGDMFEMGSKVQVLKKGVLFPSRANKLYELYRRYNSIEEIDELTKEQIQTRYFKKTFEQVWDETRQYHLNKNSQEIARAENNPKYKMALIFKWYFNYSTTLSLKGTFDDKVNYQVHCGPALGAFNQFVKNTDLEDWRNRHVDDIAHLLLNKAAELLSNQMNKFLSNDNEQTRLS